MRVHTEMELCGLGFARSFGVNVGVCQVLQIEGLDGVRLGADIRA